MTPDLGETIKGLELVRDICQAKAFISAGEGRTAWNGYAGIQDNAITLLREKEPVRMEAAHGELTCSGCGIKMNDEVIYFTGKMKYCPNCGKDVVWDGPEA